MKIIFPDTKKVFACYWSGQAFSVATAGHNELSLAQFGEFTEFNGYDDKEQNAIRRLDIGQTWTSDDYGDDHRVTRIQ